MALGLDMAGALGPAPRVAHPHSCAHLHAHTITAHALRAVPAHVALLAALPRCPASTAAWCWSLLVLWSVLVLLPRMRASVRMHDTVARMVARMVTWMVTWTTPLPLATPLHVVMRCALVLSVPMPMPLNVVLALLLASHGNCAVKDIAQIT